VIDSSSPWGVEGQDAAVQILMPQIEADVSVALTGEEVDAQKVALY
jgi:hypothetical protein